MFGNHSGECLGVKVTHAMIFTRAARALEARVSQCGYSSLLMAFFLVAFKGYQSAGRVFRCCCSGIVWLWCIGGHIVYVVCMFHHFLVNVTNTMDWKGSIAPFLSGIEYKCFGNLKRGRISFHPFVTL